MARKIPSSKPSSADLRALRDQRLAAQADPTQEAARHEASFLANLSRAQSDFEWLAEHHAWILLGFASLAEWWEGRVRPVLDALALRPAPEMAQRVIEMILAAEAELPAAQRRSKKELAALVGASEWKARAREDHRQRRSAAGSDLEDSSSGGGSDTGRGQNSVADNGSSAAGALSQIEGSPEAGEPALPVGSPAQKDGIEEEEQWAATDRDGGVDSPDAATTALPEDSPTGQPQVPDVPEGEPPTATGQSGAGDVGVNVDADVSGEDHPVREPGEAPTGLLVEPVSGAGVTPSDEVELSGDETAEGSPPESSAVDPQEPFTEWGDDLIDVIGRRPAAAEAIGAPALYLQALWAQVDELTQWCDEVDRLRKSAAS